MDRCLDPRGGHAYEGCRDELLHFKIYNTTDFPTFGSEEGGGIQGFAVLEPHLRSCLKVSHRHLGGHLQEQDAGLDSPLA